MTTETIDLTDFLLARFDEDEAEAVEWPTDGNWGLHSPGIMWMDPRGRPIYAPRSRVLAECEAKRRIVEEHSGEHNCTQTYDAWDDADPCPTLRLLALPYAGLPGWREEWRP